MTSGVDLNNIIENIVSDYVKPEHPIYRVKYVHTYIDEGEYYTNEKLHSRIVSRLMECRLCGNPEENEDLEKYTCPHAFQKMCIHNSCHYIFPKTIEEFDQKEVVADYIDPYDHVTIIDLQRVA